MRRPFTLLCGWVFLMSGSAMAQIKLPSLFGDHMVLQRGMPLPVWGQDNPNQTVTVTIAGKTATAQAGSDGKWKAILPSLKAGGPFELVVSGSGSVTIRDVLVGEVWVAAGQSNMELPLNNTSDSANEVPKANNPQIRWFVQGRRLSNQPEEEPIGDWKVCDPGTAKNFSATAYYFAKKIHKDLKVPVGMIGTYWGGTWIESWMPEEAFETNPSIKPLLVGWNSLSLSEQKARSGLQRMELEIKGLRLTSNNPAHQPITLLPSPSGSWSSNAQPGSAFSFQVDSGVGHVKADVQTGGWGNCTTSLAPDDASVDLSAYDFIEFEAKGSGKFNVLLEQPIITDWDNYGSEPFEAAADWKSYQIPFYSLQQSGWGKPMPLQLSAVNGFCLNACVKPMGMRPVGLFNGMVAPLIPYGMRGAIWYQGETNVGQAENYRKLLPAMIQGWRKSWGEGNFPFIIAQLPNWHDPNATPGNGWPELREAQAAALDVPHTGLAVLIDVGESKAIHPKDKIDVGYRLGLAALHEAYGKKGPYSGPLFDSLKISGKKLIVTFKHADKGLKVKGDRLVGFEIVGEDNLYVTAQAKISGKEVVVWSDRVSHPKGTRYAWADDPGCNLYNGAGLPAAPFRAEVKP